MSSDAIYFARERIYHAKSFPFFGATIPRASSTGEIVSSGSFDRVTRLSELILAQFGILQIPIPPPLPLPYRDT